MNILPLVLAFVMIFSYLSFTFFKEIRSFSIIETSLDSYHHTERVVTNELVKREYEERTRKRSSRKTNKRKTQKKTLYQSRRSLFPPNPKSKFNFFPLVESLGEPSLHPLYEPFVRLLKLLYHKKLFTQPEITYTLVDALLDKARKHPEIEDLAELYPDDPTLASLYYQMLKGTNQYSRVEGIPPLSDFIFTNKKAPVISFNFASPQLLEAIFDKKTADTILLTEKKRGEAADNYYYFPKDELPRLFTQSPKLAAQFAELEPYLNYLKTLGTKDKVAGRDKTTGLSVAKKI